MEAIMQPATAPQESSSDSRLIAKSVVRAAEKLEISNRVLARIIGVSDATVSRLKKGEYPLESSQKPFQLAVLFIRLYRSLDALTGGDDEVSAKWLSNPNTAFSGAPIELIQSVSGLMNVINYLDARRAVV
jgi:predicted transcriptional regulator